LARGTGARAARAGAATPGWPGWFAKPARATETALAVIAGHRDHAGRLLKERVAAVELLNVLRPTVAISTFLTFAMLALHRFPETRGGVTEGRPRPLEGTFLEAFVHEVRRYYPFFPFAAARACREFVWRDHRFPLGRLVLLDLYGTNRDPALWQDPADFMPSRFLARKPGPYTFIPQGGGDYYAHHRCAGEWITVELMKRSLRFLVAEVPWEVPPQDLSIDLRRMPTRPASGFILTRR
jgi:fatty-acid peroxygenase